MGMLDMCQTPWQLTLCMSFVGGYRPHTAAPGAKDPRGEAISSWRRERHETVGNDQQYPEDPGEKGPGI